MVGAAILFDTIQIATKGLHAIPGLGSVIALFSGWIVSVLAWLVFYLWFRLSGVGLLDKGVRKLLLFLAGFIIELIPIINAVPAWTFTVASTVATVKMEDAHYNKEQKEKLEKLARSRG